MTVVTEERKNIDDIFDLFTEYMKNSHKVTDEKKIEQIFTDLKGKIKDKKRIIFVTCKKNKPIGFLIGNIERDIVETTGFYIQDGFDSENCGFQLITSLTNTIFERGFKHYRQTITLPANFVPSLKGSLKDNGFMVYPRVQMLIDLQKDEFLPTTLPENYFFEPFSKERVDEIFQLMKEANHKDHPDTHIYPEMLEPEKSKAVFSRISNEFNGLDIDINPQIIFENKLIGLSFIISPNSEIAFIAEISVSPYHQRKGLGKALTNKVISECGKKGYKKLGLAVTVENTTAYKLYKKLDFKTTTNYLSIVKSNQ